MPDDRLFHKTLGHSSRVNVLSDFERGVWWMYRLASDDFGLMRFSAVTLQESADWLEQKPAKTVHRAMEAVVKAGLIRTFEHQGRIYCFQHDWQSWQKITHPRQTTQPLPPADLIAACDANTKWLFSHHPKGGRLTSWQAPDALPIESGRTTDRKREESGSTQVEKRGESGRTTGAHRENSRPVFMGNGGVSGCVRTEPALPPEKPSDERPTGPRPVHQPPDPSNDSALSERAGRFCERYADMHEKFRKGAKLVKAPAFRSALGAGNMDYQEALTLVSTWDDARLDVLAEAFLKTEDDAWIDSGPRTLARFRSRASWCDERLRDYDARKGNGRS